MKIDNRTRDNLWKLFLRTVPFVPAPEIYDLLHNIRRSQTDFDQQVTEAVEGLHKTSELVATLQKGVEERMAKLQEVRQEHDKYSELAQIEAKKAEAVLKQVEATLGRDQRKERWIALAMHLGVGFLFFVLGVILSDAFKGWIDRVWTKIVHEPVPDITVM